MTTTTALLFNADEMPALLRETGHLIAIEGAETIEALLSEIDRQESTIDDLKDQLRESEAEAEAAEERAEEAEKDWDGAYRRASRLTDMVSNYIDRIKYKGLDADRTALDILEEIERAAA